MAISPAPDPTLPPAGLDLDPWLRRQAATLQAEREQLIRDARFFRVSSSQPSIFVANLAAGLLAADHGDPDVATAKEVGGLLVERTREGAECRRARGTLDIRRGMFTGGAGSDRLIGHATLFGSTLFVYLLASAAKADLTDTEHPEDGGNAATEVVRTVIRALSGVSQDVDPDYRLRCHFTDETRASRSRPQAAKLVATAKHHRALLILRGTEWDVRKVTDSQIIDQLLGMAATERDFAVQRLVRGKASLLIANRLPESLGPNVPFTHEAYTAERTDERGRTFTLVDDHWPVPRPGSGGELAGVIRAVLAAADDAEADGVSLRWDTVAAAVGEQFCLASRAPEHQGGNVPLHTLDSPGTAFKRMMAERYRTAWRTGRMPWIFELTTEIEGLTDQLETFEIAANGNRRVMAWIDCPIPEGLDITAEEWERLDQLLSKSSRAGKPPSGWERPLRGTAWIHDGWQWSVQLSQVGMYRAEKRPVQAAQDDRGGARGWARTNAKRAKDGTKVAVSVNANRLNAAIGKEVEALAVDLEGQVLALRAAGKVARRRPEPEVRMGLLAELENLRAEAEELEMLQTGARTEKYRAAAARNEEQRDKAQKDEDQYGEHLQDVLEQCAAKQRQIDTLEIDPRPTEERVGAAIGRLEELAAALQIRWRPDGLVPPEVCAVARPVFGQSLRLEPGPTAQDATWRVQVRVPLADGRTGVYERSGIVPSSIRSSSAHKAPADVARRFMWDGDDLVSIGTSFGIDGSGKKNSHLLHKLKTWLQTPGTASGLVVASADLRRVILDAPLVARRTVFAWLTDRVPEILAEGTNRAYLELMKAVYIDGATIRWSESWTSGPFSLQRQLLSLILSQPDPTAGVGVLEAAHLLGVAYEDVVALSGCRGGTPRAVARNWERVGARPMEARRLSAVACPWEDCPGHRAGGRASAVPLATHFLHVPEVPGGLLCPTCRRVPDLTVAFAEARFPEAYFVAHRRRTVVEDGTRIGTRLESASWAQRTLEPLVRTA